MSMVRGVIAALLLGGALLFPVLAQDSDGELQERLREVLLGANVDAEQAREVVRILERTGWGELEPEDIGAILPALGYAQREGEIPPDPGDLAELARNLGRSASELRRLGFTTREAARTLSIEARRRGLPRGAAGVTNERPLPESARDAIRRAERERLRDERRGREVERGSRPGFVPGTPKGRSPAGFDPGDPGEFPDDDDDYDYDDDD